MQKAKQVVNNLTLGGLPVAPLGKDGPLVNRLGYGTMGLSAFYGQKKPDPERFAVLDKLYNDGERFWDTADIYQDSEDLLGKSRWLFIPFSPRHEHMLTNPGNWFKQNPGKRENIFLATKFANKVDSQGNRCIDTSPEYTKSACAKSLSRLGVHQIDLYYAHRLDGKTPVEKTVEALAQLKEEGKIKYLGLSECSAESLRRACKVHHISAVQIEYSPFSLDIESSQIGLLKACRELGVAIVAYSPIGRGMLGGELRSHADIPDGDFRKLVPRFSEENFPKNLALVDRITEIAKKKGCTASQLTLAWILAQGDDFFPIPGTTNLGRIDENLGSLKVHITKEEEAEIRHACEKAEVSGGRYPEGMAATLFADTPAL